VPDATLFPDTRGPRAGVRRAVDVWNRARGGSARSLNAVASRVAVARTVASPRVPGFAFVRGMGAHAPASDDFIVILADALAGKNALLPATAPLLAAARPMRAAVTPRPAPDTARLAMDMQREADIVDVRCGWNGRRALEAGPKPQNPACEMRRDVSKPNRGRYQLVSNSAGRVFFFFSETRAESRSEFFAFLVRESRLADSAPVAENPRPPSRPMGNRFDRATRSFCLFAMAKP
jgi:hypothetical protein